MAINIYYLMEIQETPETIYNDEIDEPFKNNIIQRKSYEIKTNENMYELIIEIISDNNISFKAKQKNIISFSIFSIEYKYDDLIKKFFLEKSHYENIYKIFDFLNISIEKNKISLIQDKNNLKLILKKLLDYDEVDCCIELKEKKLKNEEKLNALSDGINELKKYYNNNEKDDINLIKKENEELRQKINFLIEENKIIKKEKEEMEQNLKSSIEEIKNDVKLLIDKNQNIQNGYKKDDISKKKEDKPPKLSYIENLTEYHKSSGKLYNFEVFTRLTDNIEYLVYSNQVSVKNDKKEYYNLQIMRILDNKIIKTLVGHNNKTTVIRYFTKDNKEEYILSCDISNLILIWDIQYNYDIKYAIKEDRIDKEDIIYDSILLFNILGKNYISIPSYSEDKFTKLYEFNNNTPFIKNIYKTKNNKTLYTIQWFYNNNYYIIECCEKKISISNILEDKLYGKLYLKKDGMPLSGYLYKDNYLIVSDGNNNYIRIWDLINKIQIKKINTESIGREIVPWNSSYIILACYKNIKIIDLEEEKIISEIEDVYAYGLKKINISQYGECLVISNSSNIIKLYTP